MYEAEGRPEPVAKVYHAGRSVDASKLGYMLVHPPKDPTGIRGTSTTPSAATR